MSLEKEFIPYEQALALKELGFDEPCFCYWYWYTQQGSFPSIRGKDIQFNGWKNYPDSNTVAPLYQQAFRFFREKYSIQATIEPTKDQHRFELGFNYWIWNTKTDEEWFTEPRDRPAGDYIFDTYEEAELACLKKLIELVKSK